MAQRRRRSWAGALGAAVVGDAREVAPRVYVVATALGVYADIVTDFIAQGTKSMQIHIEGMKPATLRAGLRRALKGNEGVKMAQRGEETYLVRQAKE